MVKQDEFNVWPLMIDMLTSILIIFILFSFFNRILLSKNLEQQYIQLRKNLFYKDFQPLFQKELDAKKIAILDEINFLNINFSDNILFTSGSYRLNAQGMRMLDKFQFLIPSLNDSRGITNIQVEGHTDKSRLESNTFPKNNWELSAARALSVVEYLTEMDYASNPSIFSANALSEYHPISNEDSANRRIEIKIFFSDKNK